tara:strand:+ start:714 stop:1973 length:1260 start_codon:yes stop_codon:yes gene_type:complete
MKRVLYIVANPFNFSRISIGGNISSANGVINGFRGKGYHVDVVTDSRVPTLDNDCDNLTTIFYPYRRIRSFIPFNLKGLIGKFFNKIDHLFFRFAMNKKVSNLIKENNYEFCYMRSSNNGHAVVKSINNADLDLVVEVNKPLSMGPFNNKENLNWPKKGQKVSVPIAEIMQYDAAKVITVDSSVRAKWVTEFVGKKYEKKILVNYNGVNTEMFIPYVPNRELFEELQISNQDIVVGMASSFRWYNDVDELCAILSKASMKIDRLKSLIIVGDKKKEKEIYNKIIQYNLQDKTKLLCQVPFEKMPSLLNCCDILISHFNFHGKWPHNCSIKHLEYLSTGKPTVASDVGEVNFAIEHQVNGLLCQEGNIEQFSNSIADLAIDSKLRTKLGNSGRKKAIKELSWEANITRILDFLYEKNKIN